MVCFIPRGSSPRMRGTRPVFLLDRLHDGIIPAYAGNTSLPRPYSTRSRDHPRVCGEHATSCLMASMSAGSSPRMRGTPGRHALHWRSVGIIPAYAGNTDKPPIEVGYAKDHPRVCGEHNLSSFFILGVSGSSPRMRGTHLYGLCYGVHHGIIPAYAGNTFCSPLRR